MVSLRDQKKRERDRKKRGEKTEKKKGDICYSRVPKVRREGGVLKGREKGKVTWKT